MLSRMSISLDQAEKKAEKKLEKLKNEITEYYIL